MQNNELIELLHKYHFLNITDGFTNVPLFTDDEAIEHNYYVYWDNTGWADIWKRFLSKLFIICDSLSEQDKSLIYFIDIKEKFGYMRVDLAYPAGLYNKIHSLEIQLELLSSVTCIKCGKIPKNSKGQSLIWRTRGWVSPLCKNCAKKELAKRGYNKAIIKNELKNIREVTPAFIIKSHSPSDYVETHYVLCDKDLKEKEKIIIEINSLSEKA